MEDKNALIFCKLRKWKDDVGLPRLELTPIHSAGHSAPLGRCQVTLTPHYSQKNWLHNVRENHIVGFQPCRQTQDKPRSQPAQ